VTSLDSLNALPLASAVDLLRQCCGSLEWARRVAAGRPYASDNALLEAAEEVWWGLRREDWLEAFRAHPRLGDYATEERSHASDWSNGEQSEIAKDGGSRSELQRLNREYEKHFGWIFILCATGKSADDVRRSLIGRMDNDPASELRVAAEEQSRITRLRIRKLLAADMPVTEGAR
jgi:OHCU decarboxylase